MKKGTKIVIGFVIGLVITIGLIIGLVIGGLGGFIYLTDRAYKEGAEKEKQARVAGREFGRTSDQNGCIEKGFTLKREISTFDRVILDFVGECLESSEPIPNFCDGVPDYEVGSGWNAKQCEKVPIDAPCHDTIYAKQSYCKFFQDKSQVRLEGREFGKTTDQNGCMEKGFALPNDFLDKTSFTSGCLRTSRPTPDFCKGVQYYEPKWADEQCKQVGDNKDSCIQAFEAKRHFCR